MYKITYLTIASIISLTNCASTYTIMISLKLLVVVLSFSCFAHADNHSAFELLQDIYYTCLKDFSVSCVQPKSVQWMNEAFESRTIKITDDLSIVKKEKIDDEVNVHKFTKLLSATKIFIFRKHAF